MPEYLCDSVFNVSMVHKLAIMCCRDLGKVEIEEAQQDSMAQPQAVHVEEEKEEQKNPEVRSLVLRPPGRVYVVGD